MEYYLPETRKVSLSGFDHIVIYFFYFGGGGLLVRNKTLFMLHCAILRMRAARLGSKESETTD